MSRQIILDTETTGLSADNGDRLIELGCVEMVNRKLTGNNLHLYFNAGRDSHPDALRVHGITTEFLKDKPRFEQKVDEIWEYLQGAELIIHNAPFDLGFLNKELELANRPPIRQCVSGVIDTLVMAKEMGIDARKMNRFGCSLVWGHPQAPMGIRGVIELIEELVIIGGGYGLFVGCAAGDSAMAVVVRVQDE